MDATPMETSSASQKQASPEGSRLRGFALFSVLAALMLTLLLESLDQTVVGTALPRIVGTLQGFDRYTWVVTAYILASVTMVPIVGKLSDQFGRKWFLIAGTIIFLLGSALAGASQNMNELIAFRAVQGLGAGMGIALVLTVVGDIFSPAERARWQGVFGVVYGFSNLAGPTLGGWLTDHGPLLGSLVTDTTRWRWVFYVNLPVGILALLIYLPASISVRTSRYTGWAAVRRIDFLGAILTAAATICLLLGLTWGSDQTYDWTSVQVIGVLAAAAVLYIVFFLVERFAAEPVLPLGLFRNRVFAAASLLSLLQLMTLIGLIVYLPLFLQDVLGESATYAGAVLTPLTISSVIGASVASALVATFKRYQLVTIIGCSVASIGIFLLAQMTISTSLLQAAIFMVIAGIGLGVLFSVLTLAAQNALPRTSLGVGTGAVRFLGQLGGVLGLAIVGTVVNNTLASELAKRVPAQAVQRMTPAGVKFATNPQALVSPTYHDTVVKTAQFFTVHFATANVPPGPRHDQLAAQAIQQTNILLAQIFAALREALAVAIQHGLLTVFIFSVASVVVALFLKDLPLVERSEYQGEESGEAAQSEANTPALP